jgi:chromosome segregation ATPase
MEKEQLEKKIEWLDAERRKAFDVLSALDKRLVALEKSFNKETASAKTISGHTSKLKDLTEKIEALGEQIKTNKTETKTSFLDFEKQRKQQERSFEQEQRGLHRVLDDFRKEISQIQALQTGLNQRSDEIEALSNKLDLVKESVQEVIAGEQRRNQIAASLEESSKEDAKRLTEMHGEVAALLTRLESAAKQTETMGLSQRKVEKRMDEVTLADSERQKEHDAALQRLAVAEADREHRWKEWDKRFATVEQLASDVAGRLKEFDSTEIALKRAETAFNDLIDKINRRVNELGEIQRLGDQRFRQEWSTFQADAQKRWSSFALTQEEHQRETARQREKLADQIKQLDDQLAEIQDTVQHLREQSERSMQTLFEMARESLAEHERFASNSR